jgi:hypothetical protein
MGEGESRRQPTENLGTAGIPVRKGGEDVKTGSQRDRYYYRNQTFCPKHPYQDAGQSSSPTSSKR